MGFSLGSIGSVVYDIISQDKTGEGIASALAGAGRLKESYQMTLSGEIAGAEKLGTNWRDLATTGLGLAGVGITVGAAMYATGSRAADYADYLDDLARTTGFSTDALQELRYVTGQMGGDFDRVAAGVEKMTRNLGALKAGSDMDKALKELGVDIRDVNGAMLPTQEILPRMIEALGRVEDPMKRNALASTIFGRDYKGMMELVGLSVNDWDRMTTAAHKAGMVISKEDVAAAASFKASQAELNQTMEVFINQLGVSLMPLLKELPGALREIQPVIEGIAAVIRNTIAFNYLTESVEAAVMGDVEGAARLFEQGQRISQDIQDDTKNVNDALQTQGDLYGDVGDAAKEGLGDAKKAADDLKAANDDLQTSFKDLWDIMREIAGLPRELKELELDAAEATLDQAEAADKYSAAIQKRTKLETALKDVSGIATRVGMTPTEVRRQLTEQLEEAKGEEKRAEITYKRESMRQYDVQAALQEAKATGPGSAAWELQFKAGAAGNVVSTAQATVEKLGGASMTFTGDIHVTVANGQTVPQVLADLETMSRNQRVQAGVPS